MNAVIVPRRATVPWFRRVLDPLLVLGGAGLLTLAFFAVLPLIQEITKPPAADMVIQSVDSTSLPPPPPPMEEEPEEEPEEEEPPPELEQDIDPLTLDQLELVLNPGFGGPGVGGDFALDLNTVTAAVGGVDSLFSLADLDQAPRVIYQPGPVISDKVRKRAPGTVYVLFIVDKNGRVENPIVQQSTDSIFEKPALSAVKQWKFEPGKREGEPVRFRMRVPITFPRA